MKYRKKPVVIEAKRWDGTNFSELCAWMSDNFIALRDYKDSAPGVVIKTLEGDLVASMGDYIIKGVQGEFYPCKPDIFKATYDKEGSSDE